MANVVRKPYAWEMAEVHAISFENSVGTSARWIKVAGLGQLNPNKGGVEGVPCGEAVAHPIAPRLRRRDRRCEEELHPGSAWSPGSKGPVVREISICGRMR